MVTLTIAGENAVLNHLFTRAGTELALATDATFTEVDDPAYDRADLPDALAAPDGGAVINDTVITFDCGSDVATHWMVLDPDTSEVLAYGQLPSPQTGEFTFPIGSLRIEAISG